jgi:hypothetical protein
MTVLAIIGVVALAVAYAVVFIGGLALIDAGRAGIGVSLIIASCAALAVGLLFLLEKAEERADRRVEECIEKGGIPDRYGREGNKVTCYLPRLERP